MESPGSWDLLTSSLAVSDLSRAGEAWAFLVVQGLVSGEPSELEQFTAIVDRVQREGEITGPSQPLRIAGALHRSIKVLPNADMPDPMGEVAMSRYETAEMWRKDDRPISQTHGLPQVERSWQRLVNFLKKRRPDS